MLPEKVLMVCLGNICRSPIAEAVFIKIAKEKGLQDKWIVDSAALGAWHVGRNPDHRALKVLNDRDVPYNNKARQIKKADFETFDYIFGMDYENIDELEKLKPSGAKAQILLLGEFDPKGEKIIRDPYYDDGSEGFVKCYDQCIRCCTEFIKRNS